MFFIFSQTVKNF